MIPEELSCGLAKRVGKGLAQVALRPPILEFPKLPFKKAGLSLHGYNVILHNST